MARGWSNESVADAQDVARRIALRVAQRLAQGGDHAGQYQYGDRPLPEPIVREFPDAAGATRAALTRNAYGALVLNTRDLMFIDIDTQEELDDDAPAAASAVADLLTSGLRSLFGKAAPPPPPPPPPRPPAAIPASILDVAQRNGVSGRVYITAAGFRVLVSNARYTAGDAASQALLQQFGSDPLYVRLCSMQQSFRARLTPKPWRCDLRMPPVTFPFETAAAESQYNEWVRKYDAVSQKYATCRFLGVAGAAGSPTEPDFEELIALHDQETKANTAMPLA